MYRKILANLISNLLNKLNQANTLQIFANSTNSYSQDEYALKFASLVKLLQS